MQIFKVKYTGPMLDAIKWESNEPEIREFVGDDKVLRFKDEGLEVWNRETKTWENCAIFSFIVKTPKGNFFVVSPEEMNSYYSIQ